ncbi:MAG: DUF2157 domain-containing protein, partial [Ghiorsea sp.]|nr:DUF2157 domain-containing protein [Ghiorsea sp.]
FSVLVRFLLVVGAVLLVSALTFFIAYNWADMSRLAKFTLLEVLIVLAVFAYWMLDVHQLSAKIALLTASLLLGVLLALYGQTYQTGADPWQLFFNWALLILPWVILAQFPALWIVFIFLLNLSLVLYMQTFGGLFGLVFTSEMKLLWPLFVLNAVALFVWEYMSQTKVWLQSVWATRLLAVASGTTITILLLDYISSTTNNNIFSLLIWLNYLFVLYMYYRKKKPDLFMLAGCCLSVSIVILVFIAQHTIGSGSSLIFSVLIIALGGASSMWLKHVQKEMQS